MPVLVDVVATRGHVEDRLLLALTDGSTSAVAPGTVGWDDFLIWLCAAVVPTVSVAPAAVERLTLAAAVRSVLPVYDPAWTERSGTVDVFDRTLRALRRAGVTPAVALAAVAEVPPDDQGARTRLRVLADVLTVQQQSLTAGGWLAAGDVERTVAEALEGESRGPEALGLPERVRLWHMADLPPVRAALVTALARWLGAHGGGVEVHVVCEPQRTRLPGTLEQALRVFEAHEATGLDVQYALRDPLLPEAVPALTRWLTAVAVGFRGTEGHRDDLAVDAPVALAEAHGPEEEARWVASRVEQWLAQGMEPHTVAVVMRQVDEGGLEPLARALDDAGIPWVDGRGAGLWLSPLARALVGLPRTVARGAEREEVLRALSVLMGNAPRGGEPAPWRMAALMRDLGVESFFDTELEARLAQARRRGVSPAVTRAVDDLARDLWVLAQDGTVAEHAARLGRWIERVQGDGRFAEESRAVMADAGMDGGTQAILRALARDEAGLAAAADLVRELPSLAHAAGRAARVSAGEFGELVLDLARTRTRGAATGCLGHGGVQVLDARAAVGRSFRAVAVVGVQDGGFPARREDDGLWGDAERLALGTVLGVRLERAGTREDETVLLLGVLATGQESVAASAARYDAGGRVRAPSPFLTDLQRASGQVAERVGSDPLARSQKVPPRGTERTMRHWACGAQFAGEKSVADPVTVPREVPGEPTASGRWSEARRSVTARAAMERTRQDFFATPDAPGGIYTGRIDHDVALVTSLGLADWAGPRKPLGVTTLERAARCGFKAFALEVLQLEERPEVAETLDEKERGHLLHKLLEAGQEAAQGTRGEPTADRWAAIRGALDEAGAEFSERESRVNPSLLEADLRAVRRQVETWLDGRLADEGAWSMLETEVAFGPRKRWPALEIAMPDGQPVVLKGRIDGVEQLGDSLRVVEFKSGRGDGFRRRLQEGVLDTQFQLVVYAAALERARQAGRVQGAAPDAVVDGVYVGFRDLTEHGLRDAIGRPRRRAPAVDVQALVTQGAHGEGALGDAVRRVVAPLRRGVFDPRPRDCDFCQYRSLCRVEAHEESPEGEP